MRSKRLLSLILLVVSLLSACSSPFNDRKKKNDNMQMGGGDSQCLSTAGKNLQRYFDGASSDEEIGAVWDCASHALELFEHHTKGATPGSYSGDELRRFFEKFFLGEARISDKLLVSGMLLKHSILGGDSGTLSSVELSRTRDLIRVLKEESIRLRPYQPLRPASFADRGDGAASAAAHAVVESAARIGNAIGQSAQDYSMEDLETLLNELKLFFSSTGGSFTELDTLIDILPVFRSVKGILVSRPDKLIKASDWAALLVTGTKWYSWVLRFSQFSKTNENWMWGDSLEKFRVLLIDAKDLLAESIQTWPKATVPFETLDGLIDAFGDQRINDWILTGVSARTMKISMRPLVLRMLAGPDQGPTGRKATGLTIGAIERTWLEFDRFVEGQRYLVKVFNAVYGTDWSVSSSLPPDTILEKSKDLLPPSGSLAADAVNDMMQIVKSYRPLFVDDVEGHEGPPRVSFQAKRDSPNRHTFYNLYQMNWMRMVARIIVRGYANSRPDETDPLLSRARKVIGLSQVEVQGDFDDQTPYIARVDKKTGKLTYELTGIYADFYNFGVDLGLFDKDSTGAGNKRFLEGNLFSYAANGGYLLDVDELTQMVAFMISAARLSSKIHNGISSPKVCGQIGVDKYGKPRIDAKCYRREFYGVKDSDDVDGKIKSTTRLQTYVSEHMPILWRYYSSLTDEKKAEFREYLEIAARNDPSQPSYDSDDTLAIATLLHYIEAIFVDYDDNNTWALSKGEMMDGTSTDPSAFSVFSTQLSEKAGKKNIFMLKNIFTFLLKYGRAPVEGCWKDTFKMLFWMARGPLQHFQADRITLLKILAALSAPETKGCPKKAN